VSQATLGFANASPPPPRDRRAALALALAEGVGPVRHKRWSHADGGAEHALERRLTGDVRARALDLADAALESTKACHAHLVLLGDDAYPTALLDLSDPPPALWALGDRSLHAGTRPCVAIVGTRDATAYGERAAASLGRTLAGAGVVVVSGMARGIDAAAHVASLDAGGGTIAVLGSGVDVAYPRSHRALHRRIVTEGLVLSELPPGSAPTPGAFPRRNRIIAALARATIVVEAGFRSGALITAGVALELGREVGAVPGPIDVGQAAGSNALLRDGAAVVAEAGDAVALAGLAASAPNVSAVPEPAALGEDELTVWRALATRVADVDTLCTLTELPARRCVAALGALEAAGHVRMDFGGTVARS
jgi:DNA processing protein